MAAHAIAKVWRSEFNGTNDFNFDLTRLLDTGNNVRECNHNGKSIAGTVRKIRISDAPPVDCFLVKINEVTDDGQTLLQYRGVAIFNPATQTFNKIVGVRMSTDLGGAPRKSELTTEQLIRALTQDEGTWVGTQP